MKNPETTLLIVDDEKNTREGLARALQRTYRVLTAESGPEALRVLQTEPVDLVLSDVRMPEMDGLTLMKRAQSAEPPPVFVLLTAYGTIDAAVEATKAGAYDYLTKPVDLDRLETVLQRALASRKMEVENRRLREQLDQRFGLESIIGQSPQIRELQETIRQVAPSRATVLIEGESGTGKELVARALHQLSPRSRGPFIAVHCAALSPTLLESELFGHERGAFTGAVARHTGRFEAADGGTLFLDEIGEIAAGVQVKILRALEEHRFERVGGSDTVEVDVRLIAATNRNLPQMVAEGRFREDLYYRLNVVTIVLPPLRERAEDIPLLVAHFLQEFSAENEKPTPVLSPEAMDMMLTYPWPGNVRELRNAIERMVVLAKGDRLTVRDLPPALREHAQSRTGGAKATAEDGRPSAFSLEETERRMILRALEAVQGNRARAAEQLGISRRTLHRKLNEYGLRNVAPAGRRGRRAHAS
jgi:DNA-binding NtrC family response regulator